MEHLSKIFFIRNENGEYLRKPAYQTGRKFTDSIWTTKQSSIKPFNKLGHARTCITFLVKNHKVNKNLLKIEECSLTITGYHKVKQDNF